MFLPVPPTDPQRARRGLIGQMTNGDGVAITMIGIGRHDQWAMEYEDAETGLKFSFDAWRTDDLESTRTQPPKDFWYVQISPLLGGYFEDHDPGKGADKLFNDIGLNIAEGLFRWQRRDINALQAQQVRIYLSWGYFSTEGPKGRKLIVDLPAEWRSSNG